MAGRSADRAVRARAYPAGVPRLDQVLHARGLAESRARAQALVMAGLVTVEGRPAAKAGMSAAEDAAIDVRRPPPYVSRGGEKLATMLDRLCWDVNGAEALDVGASTGGFTDCLLQRVAARVIALDVGRGQLHSRLTADSRVVQLDRTNARTLEPGALPYAPDLLVADVSFISLRLVLGPALATLRAPWRAVVLVKPQFEAGRDDVPRGGVVREAAVRVRALADVARYAAGLGAVIVDACDSQLPGPAGNREYLLALASPDHPAVRDRAPVDPDSLAECAVHG
jgi:23S rRNA (cytidine1920-2'-O)/16S rRNA (cytidine1409-2'-O)-methyltransferase